MARVPCNSRKRVAERRSPPAGPQAAREESVWIRQACCGGFSGVRSSTQSRKGAKKKFRLESSGRADARPFFCTVWFPLRLRAFASRFSVAALLKALAGALHRLRDGRALSVPGRGGRG